MSDPGEPSNRGVLRTTQIIAAALLLGVLAFLGIVLYIVLVQNQGRGQAPPGPVPMLTYVAAGMLAVTAPLSFLVPARLMQNALRQIARGEWRPSPQGPAPPTDAGKLMVVRQTTMIVGLALLEGTNFLGCIAYLLEANPVALGVVGVGVVLMLLRFPTEGGVRAWLDEQTERVELLRQQPEG